MGAANVGGGGGSAQPSLVALQPLSQLLIALTHAAVASQVSADVSVPAAHVGPAPQAVPTGLFASSRHVITPVVHDVTPVLHFEFGFVVHGAPAMQATQVPALLQTMSVPQDVPADFIVSLLQTIAPVLQLLTPVKHLLGFVVQLVPEVQATHVPEPLHTMPEPQLVPADLLPPSMHVIVPVVHDVVPFLHAAFGLLLHVLPAVHATQVPDPLHTMLVPQLVPAALLVPSTHVIAPVVHDVVPFLHAAFGLLLHVLPAVQATHAPVPLHTRFVPQPVPAALLVESLHVMMPVAHAVAPFLQAAFGFELHVWLRTQPPHEPMLQTWFVPQVVPLATFPVSTQTATPITHETAPVLQWFVGWQAVPGVHAPHVPLLQTMFVPHDVPLDRFCSVSEQAIVGEQTCVPA